MKMAPKGSNLKKAVHNADLVTNRGTLKEIGCHAYLRRPLHIVICKFGDLMFMHKQLSDKERYRHENVSPYEKKAEYRGHKFEQCMTTEPPEVRAFLGKN
jgi:hypothetical protein